MDDNQLAIVKTVVRWTVVAGTSKIVHDIIENNTTQESLVEKTKVLAGSFAIGGLIAEAASEYTDTKVDEMVQGIRKLKGFFQGDTPESI